MERLRAVLDLHAWVEDVHIYSGVMISYRLQLRGEHIADLAAHLREADASLDAESEAALASFLADHPDDPSDVPAMLNATFPAGDADLRNEVPRVPG